MPSNILAIHAHPDDWEILAGGTLALLAEAGHSLTVVTMTDGDCGTKTHSREEIGRIRRAEAQAAATLLGARYEWAGFHDLAIFIDDDARRRVTALVRRLQPDIVLTSAPVDYMVDHEATSALVRDACFAAGAPNYRAASGDDAPPLDHIPALYFMDPIEGVDRDGRPVEPHFIIDVTRKFPLKREMLACHDSQRTWLQAHHGMDNYLTTMEHWTRRRASRPASSSAKASASTAATLILSSRSSKTSCPALCYRRGNVEFPYPDHRTRRRISPPSLPAR